MLGDFMCNWGQVEWERKRRKMSSAESSSRSAQLGRPWKSIPLPGLQAGTPRGSTPRGRKTSARGCPILRLASSFSHLCLFYLGGKANITLSSCCHGLSPSPQCPTPTLHRILGHQEVPGRPPLLEPLLWGRTNRC